MPTAVLLITDRPEQSVKLERLLSLWGPCDVVDLHRALKGGPASTRLLVSDVDLSSRAAVEAVRDRLAERRRRGTPYLCLLRDPSPRLTIQANAIGASAISTGATNEIACGIAPAVSSSRCSPPRLL